MVRTTALWLAGIGLLLLGGNVNDPYLVPIQAWSAPAIALMGLGGAVALRRRGGRLLLVLWCAVPVTVGAAEAVFHWRKHTVLSAPEAQARELGQHFVVGYTRFDEVAPLVARGLVGGIFVTRRNIAGRSAEALRREIAQLQDIRRNAGLPPLMVTTDQEGGAVSHLSPALTAMPPLASLTTMPAATRQSAAREYGAHHGHELASLGININFAPVLDVWRPHARNRLDFNSLINQRAISDDPAMVGDIALAYAQGLAENGVRPTVKHFPGMGRVTDDTHHFRAALTTPKDELAATDWRPFRQVLSGSGAMIMVGHVTVTDIDPDRPASHSRRVVDDVLRREWGYDGLVITDDLVMSAIYQHGLCTAVEEALNAGVDLLLVAFDGKQYYRTMNCALTAWREGQLDTKMLARSGARLRR